LTTVFCPACLPPTNPCLIYLILTIKPKGVIHSHLSAASLEHGGEMAVGNSRPLNRSSATLSYLHLSFHETFDITKVNNIAKDQKIVVYCSLGYRGEKIAEQLNKNGYQNVYNLYGGIFNWVKQGYPVISKEKKNRNIHPFDKEWVEWLEKEETKYEK